MAPKVGAVGVGSVLATTNAGGMVPSALARGRDSDDESAGDGSRKSGSSKRGGIAALSSSADNPNILTFGPATSASGKRIETERCTRWAELLCNRPSTGDSNAMSAWLLEVLAVSDLEKPLGAKGTSNTDDGGSATDKSNVATKIANGNDGVAAVAPPAATAKEVLEGDSAGTSVPTKKDSPEDGKEDAVTASVAGGMCIDAPEVAPPKESGGDVAIDPPRGELSKKRERSDEVARNSTKDGGEVDTKKAKTSEGEKQTEETRKGT